MEILIKLPYDLQEYIIVNVMKRYKLRDGKYVKQIDKSKYEFLNYITRPPVSKNNNLRYIFNENGENEQFFYSKIFIKNIYDIPLRKESKIDDDMVCTRVEYVNNIYYYQISIYRLKLKNVKENNFTLEKMRKDIYYKGPLEDDYFWDCFEFSYEVT
jgi:hypothetical protein